MKCLHPLIAAIFLALYASPVIADPRCDCAYDKIEGACAAGLQRKKEWIVVTSDTRRCSSVTWEINGFPQLSIVTDGSLSEALLSVPDNAKIEVRSCKICKDSNFPRSSASTTGGQQKTTLVPSPASPFQGRWSGSVRWGIFSSDISFDLSVESGRVSGTSTAKNVTVLIREGSVSGNTLTFSTVDKGGSPGSGTIRLIDERNASVTTSSGGIAFNGQISRDTERPRLP